MLFNSFYVLFISTKVHILIRRRSFFVLKNPCGTRVFIYRFCVYLFNPQILNSTLPRSLSSIKITQQTHHAFDRIQYLPRYHKNTCILLFLISRHSVSKTLFEARQRNGAQQTVGSEYRIVSLYFVGHSKSLSFLADFPKVFRYYLSFLLVQLFP